ncbi:Putative triacylglycerol lipase precursor [Mycobacteroides abscessus subsp. abscessus]|nr:Putative triacylglycerol lipase precursor [Mycobacteroides abscessus subsp. abscessus]SHU90269.1 Putative triacylglycerol lipase precursor [Mycobacteroides abscessus subsp. abscessus]SHW44728.1 Putative triacylglycerol lipase precursor [Mycobacteroides abscessus subsp. abscessus]SIH64376.1 Putative triacylglycerol lipase precursor [Mycobacteroides abscessus subsp. abscessus]SKD15621.1 Putative triacylglycerol lipase precursor [Mycobacteroides abscessus subsp. abscessus]
MTTVLALTGLAGSELSAVSHDVAQVSALPRPVTARFALTVNSGVLAVSPDGTATVYENPDSAVAVTTDRTGATTIRPVGNNTATSAGGRALPAMSTVASSSGSTLVVLDPQHTATSPVDTGQAAGATQYLPVILVHGTWSNTASEFGPTLLPALEAAGIQAFTYDYGRIPWLPINLIRGTDAGAEAPIQDSTQRLAEEITKVLAATGAPQVNLIGASQGGLVIKNYLAQATGNTVANVVDINATNHGTTLSGPGKLLDPAIVDEAFAPIHSAITGVTQTLSNTLKLAGPLRIMQGPVALAGAAAHIATGIAQEAVKIPVTAVQKVLRVALSLVIGPAGVQQAVGSEFLNRLNRTPDTRTGVNYLVLGSKDDTTATPYESTFLKASPGSAVINVEEHSLPGVKPTDVIGHVDTPKPVVDTIVRFLTAADTHPAVDTKIDRSLGVTITEDSGVTTVRSGDNTILYQGPSSNSAAVKRAIGQAIDTTATDGSTALAAGTETTQASAPETDRMLAATKTSAPDTEHADVSASASTAPVSRQATSPQATATAHQPAASGDTPSTATATNGTRATDTRPGTTASSDHTTTQTEAATATDTATKSRVRQRANTGAGTSTDNASTASGQKDSAATVADGPSTGPSTSTTDKMSRETVRTKTSAAKTDSKPKTTADSPTKTSPKTKTRETDNATTKPNDTTPRTKSTPGSSAGGTPSAKGTATAAGHAPSAQSTRGSRRDTTGSAHDGSSQHSSSPKRSDN